MRSLASAIALSHPDDFRFSFDLTDFVGIVYNSSMRKKKDTDYFSLVKKEFSKLDKLRRQRDNLDVEIAKAKQFIAATANMLPDRQRQFVLGNMNLIEETEKIAEAGLTDAIRSVLKKNFKQWLTVTQVRDQLESAGFNFSEYRSSPLASISTTLKRFKSDDVETAEIDGVAAYRWIGKSLMESPRSGALSRAVHTDTSAWMRFADVDGLDGKLSDLSNLEAIMKLTKK